MTTHILKEFPGYTWVPDADLRQPVLVWAPIPGVYSPPLLERPMRVRTFPVREGLAILPRVLESITRRSGARYLFFREGEFEVWGPSDRVLRVAISLLEEHLRT